ncbi:MAG: 50S ribosomal protein L29 [Candidatus Yanofskybacteria bacterium]|nr:50S ribosomal protein L29 [Candidatus Yanofskybacteria bacterium]
MESFQDKTKAELEQLVAAKKEEARSLRFQLAAGKVKNVRSLRLLRKDIARICTEMTKKTT